MSVDRDNRDLEAELASADAGRVGIPVNVICVGCGRIHVKRAEPEEIGQHPQVDPTTLESSDLTSFKHICHPCLCKMIEQKIHIFSILRNGVRRIHTYSLHVFDYVR